jgi:hypothetical protein
MIFIFQEVVMKPRTTTLIESLRKGPIFAFLVMMLLGVSPAFSQQLPYEYAVKCICGRPTTPVLAPGVYFTAINVHNPGKEGIGFLKKVAIALPGEKPGPVSKTFEAKLGPDEALEIDCPDIERHAGAERFLKGFVVIQSPAELDIVAVYTAAGATKQVETLALERVPPRKR